MKKLLIAATINEIQSTITWLKKNLKEDITLQFKNGSVQWDILITGVGGIATVYHLTNQLNTHSYGQIIQAGIAGSFNKMLTTGEVVMVNKEYFGDLGAENSTSFSDIFELNLIGKNTYPFKEKALINPHLTEFSFLPLKSVASVSVNKVSGGQSTIDQLIQHFSPDIESMEGAAFHYTCLQKNIPFLQLRSISNAVTIRDKSQWNIPLAIKNLNHILLQYVVTLQ
jgi:futalosine hydrolase